MTKRYDLFIGWDIGGAHLKYVCLDANGKIMAIEQTATPIWNGLDVLDERIEKYITELGTRYPNHKIAHAITMTAELSDIFCDRRTGVARITELVKKRIATNDIFIYSGKEGFITPDSVESNITAIASANWYATTSLVAQHHQCGVLVDFGSTTTDIIPFEDGRVLAQGYTDHERLATNELIYTGMIRTPVMAIVNRLEYQGQWYNVMAEHFATIADVYRITGKLYEYDDNMKAADGGDKTIQASLQRVARLIGLDANVLAKNELQCLESTTQTIAHAQLSMIKSAILSISSLLKTKHNAVLVAAGCGRELLADIADQCELQYIEFSDVNNIASEYRSAATNYAAAVSVVELLRIDCGR